MDRRSAPDPYPPWTSGIDPAPGDLRIVQAFVNTADLETGTDELLDAEELVAWLRQWRLVSREYSATETERRRAIELREGLRELLLANNDGRGDRARLAGLERSLTDLPLRCELGDEGQFRLRGVSEGWAQAAARLLTITVRAMGEGAWSRLKACRRDDCQWAFYDSSRNRSGKWCSMEGCGNLMKARAYRCRLRSRERGSPAGSQRSGSRA